LTTPTARHQASCSSLNQTGPGGLAHNLEEHTADYKFWIGSPGRYLGIKVLFDLFVTGDQGE